MLGDAFGMQGLAFGIKDGVHKRHGSATDFADPDVNLEQIVIMGRAAIAAVGFAHRQHDAPGFNVGVTLAEAADELSARSFENVQIFSVIQITHGVGFAIGDPMFVPCFRPWFYACVRVIGRDFVHAVVPCGLCAVSRMRGVAVLAALVLLLGGCAKTLEPQPDVYWEQSEPSVYTEELPQDAALYADMLHPAKQSIHSWRDLAPALARSRTYADRRNGEDIAVAHGNVVVTWADIQRTLALLEALLPRLEREPELLGSHFRWLRLTQGADFSGYYELLIKASMKPQGKFRHPIYAKPDDLHTLALGDFENRFIGQRLQYRLNKGQAVPYFTREEIAKGALRGRGLELAHVADPLDAYFLQIQGSGRLVLPDGKEQPVLFSATNGRPYTGIGRLLQDRGELAAPISYEAVRGWLEAHPDEAEALMRRNERYVFFRLAEEGPVGGMGQLLTPWVSLAADPYLLPLGVPAAFTVDVPFPSGARTVHGLGFVQDTGAAVKGRRLEMFCGAGPEAAATAGRLNTSGTVWMLLAK